MNPGIKPYFLEAGDVTPEQGWRLLRWCHAHGATEFTLDLVDDPHTEAAFALLNPLWRWRAVRDHVVDGPTREVNGDEAAKGMDSILSLVPVGVRSGVSRPESTPGAAATA